jgi:hypothetical protein
VYGNFDLKFKVRFSTHPPSRLRMLESDVCMCVGYSLDKIPHTLDDAIAATLRWFDVEGYPNERIRKSDRGAGCALGKEKKNKDKEKREGGTTGQMVLFT